MAINGFPDQREMQKWMQISTVGEDWSGLDFMYQKTDR